MKVQTRDDALEVAFDTPAPPERVWGALTAPEAIRAWWGDNFVLDARPGGSFREVWSDGTRSIVTSGAVARFEPPRILELHWADEDWPAATRVLLSIEAHEGATTRVRLVHDGWDALAGLDRGRLVADHAAGWQAHLRALAAYLDLERRGSAG